MVEVNGLYDAVFDFGYDMFIKVRVLGLMSQITVFASVLRNGVPLKIPSKALRLGLSRFVLRTNAMLKYGSFRLDPHTG